MLTYDTPQGQFKSSWDDLEAKLRATGANVVAHQNYYLDLQKLQAEELNVKVAAICVYHAFVETAVRAVEGTGIHVAAVSTGFPAGLSPLAERVGEIRRSVAAGAHEIDVVITRAHVFGGKWQALYDEIATFKEACGESHLKVILGTGDLLTLRNVARASLVAMMAGADFIKTSIGKEAVNATLSVGLVMVRAIREYAEREGINLSESYAYSDSISDLPMLSIVGHPVAVNPDFRLKQTALQHDWAILNLK